MLKQPPDCCFRACWLGCGSLPGWCSWSVNIIIYQQPSHHSRVPLILLLLLATPLLCCRVVSLRVYCTPPPSLAYNSHTRISRSPCVCCLFKSRRSNTHTTLLRKTVGAPRPLLEQLRKRSAHLCSATTLTPPSAHPLLRYPLPALLPSLLRHRLHHHLTVTHTHSFSPGCERAFLFSPRTRLIPAHLFHDLCCCKDGRRCERSFIEAQWTRQWRS